MQKNLNFYKENLDKIFGLIFVFLINFYKMKIIKKILIKGMKEEISIKKYYFLQKSTNKKSCRKFYIQTEILVLILI